MPITVLLCISKPFLWWSHNFCIEISLFWYLICKLIEKICKLIEKLGRGRGRTEIQLFYGCVLLYWTLYWYARALSSYLWELISPCFHDYLYIWSMKVNVYCINFGLSCLAVVKMAERCSIFLVKIAMDVELQSNKNHSFEETPPIKKKPISERRVRKLCRAIISSTLLASKMSLT